VVLAANTAELLRAFLQVPELSTVGSAQERAAFIAVRLDGRTVRETGDAIGVSKSQVSNLADLFQEKLAKRIIELRSERIAGSEQYRTLYRDLRNHLLELFEASGSDDDSENGHKVGSFSPGAMSREDRAEATGTSLRDSDEWN
jgi:hypothetical protein